ncbi:MAG TPA: LysM peptidoglycan-binding domain-containing protein [Steroidobacteraceae bacterium]|nr:LysM peptidoglycan-binding domain-containing protein [Steroidobacteraceae bacterium]
MTVGFTGRRVLAPLAIIVAAALAGCASTPIEGTTPPVTPVSADILAQPSEVLDAQSPSPPKPARTRHKAAPVAASTPVPAVAATPTDPSPAAAAIDALSGVQDGLVADASEGVAAESAHTLAGLTPEQYPDVFDRIRAGFKLEDIESRQIDVQINWYANNPEYLERTFGRAVPYLHHIVKEIEARGMPLELALLPVVESAFEPYAQSWVRANGLWQFMPGTGERFGLKQDWWYDGRRDVIASTRAALDYLQYMHDEFFDDWLLAIAAYNCGEFRVQREVNKNRALGKPVDFFSLSLPAETRAYVPKLLAMRRLVLNPEDYGIAFSPIPNEPYFVKVDTGGQLDLTLAAELAGITLDEVYELNPGFHRWATDPAGPHFLLLPRDTAEAFQRNLEQLSPDQRVRVSMHKIKAGETVASIAKKYKTQTTVVRDMNNLDNAAPLVIGSELRVPSAVVNLPPKVMLAAARVDGGNRSGRRPGIHVVRSGDSLWAIAKRHRMNVATLARLNGMGPGDTLRAGQKLVLNSRGGTTTASGSSRSARASKSVATGSGSSRQVSYKVRSGDTLSRIAQVFGVSVSDLVNWNGISSHATLRPGQKLTVNVRGR